MSKQKNNKNEQENNKIFYVQEENDKRESYKKSPNAKKYVTIIDQSFHQKSGLSMEAMGLMGYLISLPDDWIVQNSHLQKVFNVGRDKLRKVMKELKEKGYMQRIPIKDSKGRVTAWHTQYSDLPEFLKLVHITENPSPGLPSPGNPGPGKQPLQINNNTKKTNYKKTTQQKVSHATAKAELKQAEHSPEPDSTVVASLLEKVQQWAIAEVLLRTWLKKHSAEYILEKIEYTQAYATKNPAGLLRRAIEHDYKLPLSKQAKLESKASNEPVYPTHEENVAWYEKLSDNEKMAYLKAAVHRHPMFENHLKHQKLSVLDQGFVKNGLFKDLMQLVGRAK